MKRNFTMINRGDVNIANLTLIDYKKGQKIT